MRTVTTFIVLLTTLSLAFAQAHRTDGSCEVAAIVEYDYDNASPDNPPDVTDLITNPSFEDGTNGWENNGFALQTNTAFNLKDGTNYPEKWVNCGSQVGSASIHQTITGIPAGKYTLTAGTVNVQQSAAGSVVNNSATPQTGVSLFAGLGSVAADTLKNRSLDFIVLDNRVTPGFKAENATGNRIACDNFRLSYLGLDMTVIHNALQDLINYAESVLSQKISNATGSLLLHEITDAKTAATIEEIAAADARLRTAIAAAQISIQSYINLQNAIDEATTVYADGSGNGAAALNDAILNAQALAENLDATEAEVDAGTPASFQLMGSRTGVSLGSTGNPLKGYRIVRLEAKLNPLCFAAGTDGTTTVTTFNFTDAATAQRWFILTEDEARKTVDPEIPSPKVIESVTGDDEEPVAVEYYNLQGVRVGALFTRTQQPGVYIVKEIYPSGKVRVKKAIG